MRSLGEQRKEMEGHPAAAAGTGASPEPPGGFPQPHVTLGAARTHTRVLQLGFPARPGGHSVLTELLKEADGHPRSTGIGVPSSGPQTPAAVYTTCVTLTVTLHPQSWAPQGRRAQTSPTARHGGFKPRGLGFKCCLSLLTAWSWGFFLT